MLIIGRTASSDVKSDYTTKQISLCCTTSVKYELGCSGVNGYCHRHCRVARLSIKKKSYIGITSVSFSLVDVANQLTQLDWFVTHDQANRRTYIHIYVYIQKYIFISFRSPSENQLGTSLQIPNLKVTEIGYYFENYYHSMIVFSFESRDKEVKLRNQTIVIPLDRIFEICVGDVPFPRSIILGLN